MQAVPRCPARAAGGNEQAGSVCRHRQLAGPAAGLNPHPETAAQRFVRRFLFSPVSGRAASFTDISHFVLSAVLQQHRLKPSQQHHSTVSALFHYRFKSVSERLAQISIFYHLPVFLCYLLGLNLYFLDVLSNFQRFFKHSPSC